MANDYGGDNDAAALSDCVLLLKRNEAREEFRRRHEQITYLFTLTKNRREQDVEAFKLMT